MGIIVWTGMFLVLSVVGSAVAAAGIIGMPIDAGVEGLVIAMAVLVAGTGIALLIVTPHAPLWPHATIRDTNSFH